ncbi:MAG: BTAD domain-containing putative transcriptional regulator [Acidimicrobiales bacterium]|nr:BTAD domain-containing putative transcriptional regulator [Acidimicrobiales bacterium]
MAKWGTGGATPRRPRVEELLVQRWNVRAMQLAAGAGCGKTTALRRTIEANRTDPMGVDLFASVGDHGSLAEAIERLGNQLAQSRSDASSLIRAITALAPRHVCLIVDDAHKLDDPAALAAFGAQLPSNAHLLVGTRSRLDIDGAVLVLEDDLAFDDSEIAALAAATGRPADELARVGRWPAGVDLAATSGRAAADRAVAETLVGELGADTRAAVEAVAVLGRASDAVLHSLGVRISASALAEAVPLLRREDDDVVAHDLLRGALTDQVEHATSTRRTAAAALLASGDIEPAASHLADAGDWDAALDALATRTIGGLSASGHATARRWLDRVPPTHLDHPTCGLFRAAIARRQDPALPEVREQLERVTRAFEERGHQEGELAGLTMLGYIHSRVTGDLLGLAGVHARVVELHAAGCDAATGLAMLGDAVIAHISGDVADAARRLDALPRSTLTDEWQGIADWYHGMALLDLGRPADALAVRDAPREEAKIPMEESLHGATWARWASGDVRPITAALRAALDSPVPALPRERVDTGLYSLGFLSATGDLESARRAERMVLDNIGPDDHTIRDNLLVAQSMFAVADDDEALAADLLHRRFPTGLTTAAERRATIRLLPIPYVVDAELRADIDAQDWPGVWAAGLTLARSLVAARDGAPVEWTTLPWHEPDMLVSHLGLRWAIELCARAHQLGVGPARESCSALLEHFPTASIRLLDAMREGGDPGLAKGAASLLTELPAPPPVAVRVAMLGPTTMHRGDTEVADKDWRRERVRALLTLLVVERRVTREVAATQLWPDLEADRAAANLRTTLNYLQRVLEPDRPRNAASWLLRTDGTLLRIVDDDCLAIDVWDFEAATERAEDLERAGDAEGAVTHRLAAIELWQGDPFTECRYEDWAMPEIERLRLLLFRQLVRAAEVLAATGRVDEAITLAGRALTLEPTAENAARALVTAHLQRDDIGSARAAYRQALTGIETMGFAPEPATLELGRRLGLS